MLSLPPYVLPICILGVISVGLVLFKFYMSGGRFSGKEQIQGKTVIITGGNDGIGKETAKELARRGGRIILACRDLKKADKVHSEIILDTTNHNVIVKYLDLASFNSVRDFAKDINDFKTAIIWDPLRLTLALYSPAEPRLDILINNAGTLETCKMLTEEGFEMNLGVNYIGHFLLTLLLLEKLKSSAPSRIINVSSAVHTQGKINFDDLNSSKFYNYYAAYCQSKLANILFTKELAQRLKNTGVTVNALHPGTVRTGIIRHSKILSSCLGYSLSYPLLWLFLKSPVQGAQTSLYCALASELEGVTGKYFSDCKEVDVAEAAKDETVAKQLWAISEIMTGLA